MDKQADFLEKGVSQLNNFVIELNILAELACQ